MVMRWPMTLAEIAERMMLAKIDLLTISNILDVEIDDLEQLRSRLDIVIERTDAVESMSRLGFRAFEKAAIALEFGSPAQQMAIMRMMLSMMRKDVGSTQPKEMAGLIAEFREAIEVGDDEDDDVLDPDEVGEDEPESDELLSNA